MYIYIYTSKKSCSAVGFHKSILNCFRHCSCHKTTPHYNSVRS